MSTESEIRATIYTWVDTLSTNTGHSRFEVKTYATPNGINYSLLEEFTIATSESSWDTARYFELNTIGFKQVLTPVDTVQALRVRSEINWDYNK